MQMKTKVKGVRLADRWACERQNEASAPVCHIARKGLAQSWVLASMPFSHFTVPIATLVRLEMEKQ
jgi:hypothetical protein